MRVFKYMTNDSFEKSVFGGHVFLRASRMSDFNDPFEGSGTLKGNPSVTFAHEWLALRYLKDEASKDDATVQILCKANMLGAFGECTIFDELVRVVSFCRADINSSSDILMWSHYADSGKGVRLEFELDETQFPLKHVVYDAPRPCLDLCKVEHCDVSRDTEFANFLCDCVLKKPQAWHYECEQRLVLFLSHDSGRLHYISPIDQYKPVLKRDYLIEVPSECLKGIAIGPKIGHVGNAQDRMAAVRENGFAHVEFTRAILDADYTYRYVNLFNE